MSSESEKKRIQFRAPRGPMDRTDTPATVFGTDRTNIFISALYECFRDAAHSDEVKQEVIEAYYDDVVTLEELKSPVGHEEATNFRLPKQQSSEVSVDDMAEKLADT